MSVIGYVGIRCDEFSNKGKCDVSRVQVLVFSKCRGKSKNALKKNGPSQLLEQHDNRIANHCRNRNQHIEYNLFIKTAHFLQSGIEDIFGQTHFATRCNKQHTLFRGFFSVSFGRRCFQREHTPKRVPTVFDRHSGDLGS